MEHIITPITISHTPTLEFLKDIATTAIEGGIGYWSQATHYKWRESKEECIARRKDTKEPHLIYELRHELPFPEIKIIPSEEGDNTFKETVITSELICKGLQLYFTGGKHHRNDEGELLKALAENDAGYIDAEGADVIVQLGMFGEIVYG